MYDNIIIVPYRNRQTHLNYFIENTIPKLKEFLPNSHIVIIEQSNDKLFNRGKLLNIVIKEYQNNTNYFITHDVDINPLEHTIKEYYLPNDDYVKGIYTSEYDTLGGIVKIPTNVLITCNGFPNNFWGWGVEDKVLQNRIKFYNYEIKKNFLTIDENIKDYFIIFNDINDRHRIDKFRKITMFEYVTFNKLSCEDKKNHILSTGLNNIEYTIIDKQINDYYEIIKVNI